MIALDVRGLTEGRPIGPRAYALPLAAALLQDRPDLYSAWLGGPPPAGTRMILDLAGLGRPGRRIPTAVALHDTSDLAGLRGIRRRFRLGLLAAHAELILAPSNLVADAAVRYLRVPDARVIGARPGLGEGFSRSTLRAAESLSRRLALPDRYFVFVGSITARKNLAVLAEAWARVRSGLGDGFGLVLAGPAGSEPAPRGPGILVPGYIEPEALPALLSGAVAYLNPSLYEGCPIGTMEAMACGCPPVVGRGTALSEPMRGAGIMLDAPDPEQWARAMTVLAGRGDERARLSAECRRLAAGFSARSGAAELSSSLEAALGGRSGRR